MAQKGKKLCVDFFMFSGPTTHCSLCKGTWLDTAADGERSVNVPEFKIKVESLEMTSNGTCSDRNNLKSSDSSETTVSFKRSLFRGYVTWQMLIQVD